MANLAFQVTGFSFQGIGQFAFQGSVDTPPTPTGTGGGGVRRSGKKHEVVVRLSDVVDRDSTSEFLKSQLKLKHLPDSPFVDTGEEAKKLARKEAKEDSKREAAMRREAAIAARAFAESSAALEAKMREEAQALALYNENMKSIILIAARKS